MIRTTVRALAALALIALVAPRALSTPQKAPPQTPGAKPAMAQEGATGPKLTDAQKISLAMSAGPEAISAKATIVDITNPSATEFRQLRAGTNGWVCYASMEVPKCLDKVCQKWLDARMNKKDLEVEGTRIC